MILKWCRVSHQCCTQKNRDPEGRPLGPFGPIKLPRFSSTSYGLECHFPIIESDGLTVAVLLCDAGDYGGYIGLLLHPVDDRVQDPSRKKYYTGHGFRRECGGDLVFRRLVPLGKDYWNLHLDDKAVTAEWHDVFIADRPPPVKRDVPQSLCCTLHSVAPAPPFRIPNWLVTKLVSMGMELRPLHVESKPTTAGKPLHVSATFEHASLKEGIRLVLGTCTLSYNRPTHWAIAIPRYIKNWNERPDYSHDCVEDHVDAWPGWTKDFGDDERTVRLSLSLSTLTPAYTLVVHVQLEGHCYDALKNQRNATFPSREEILGTNQAALELPNRGS